MKKKLILFFIIFIFPLFLNAKLASVDTSHAKIELLVETNEIVVNKDFVIGIKFEIEPGWHIYWKNPGDSGLPAEIEWKNIELLNIFHAMFTNGKKIQSVRCISSQFEFISFL